MVLCLTGTGSPDSGTITTTAYYSDGSSATVTPDSYTPNPSGVVSVSGNVVTPDAGAEDGETTTITVSYEEDGITETATVDVTVTDCTSYYTLTMAVDPTGGGTTNPAVGSHTYPENEVVTLTATPALGYHFVEWTGDASGTNPTASVTMDGGKSVTANFARENIITSINIAGWENASCKPNFDHPHAPYSYTETDPSSGGTDLHWLTVTNPNLKSVHFYINFEGDANAVTYEYTNNTGGDNYVPGTLTGAGGTVLSSGCIEIPGTPSQSDYPHDFYIKIYVDGVSTYTIHIW